MARPKTKSAKPEENDTSKPIEERIKQKLGNNITLLSGDVLSSVKEWISTGSRSLNLAISNGKGYPVGRLVTIVGKKSSGKSTIVAELIKEGQNLDALVVLFDTEYTFDKTRATQLGINCEKLFIAQPDTIEDLVEQLEQIVDIAKSSKRLIIIIWDSLASTPTKSEIEGEFTEGGQYGEHSKLVSKCLRRIMGTIAESRVLFFIVNQIKTNLNAGPYADDTTYIAKLPLEFHSSVMMDIRQDGIDKDGDDPIGIFSKIRIIKNKVAPPFKECRIRIDFDSGVDKEWEALQIAKAEGRVALSGSWHEMIIPCSNCRVEEIDSETKEITTRYTGKEPDSKEKCKVCDGRTVVPRPDFNKFYASGIYDLFAKYPGLKEWFLYGTGLYAEIHTLEPA